MTSANQKTLGNASCFGPRFLNSPFRLASSFGFSSNDLFISSTEPSLSPFSSLARPRSLYASAKLGFSSIASSNRLIASVNFFWLMKSCRQLFINQKKLTEAISLFDEAIELNPNFAEAYKERGRAKLLNGDKDGSVEDMKRSLELNPKDEASLNGEFKNLGPKQEALPRVF